MYRKLFFLISVVLVLSLVGNVSAKLIAQYDFEGDANDSSGNNLHGTLGGDAKIISDPGGNGKKASNVLGVSGAGYVNCGSDDILDITGPMTYGCWAKVHVFDAQYQAIINNGPDSYRMYRQGVTDNPKVKWNNLTPETGVAAWKNVNDGQWHHIVGMYDDSKIYIFVDGFLANSAKTSGVTGITDGELWIGSYSTALERAFKGLIDEVRIYDNAMTVEEINIWKNGGAISSDKARNPSPANKAKSVAVDVVLSWRPGENAAKHGVYFGTDSDAVANATNPNALPGRGRQDANSYDPPEDLEGGKTYYWRIDEVNESNTWKGNVWSFSTKRIRK